MGSQRLFDALLELDAPVGFAVFDPSHRYLAVNTVLARRHRRSVEDHLGRRIEELTRDKAVAARAGRVIDRVVDTGEVVHTEGSPERPADEIEVLRSSWYPLRDDLGGTNAVAVFVVDDSARLQAAQALHDSRARTGKLLEIADELALAVTVGEVVSAIFAIGRRTVGADWSSVALLGPDGLNLIPGENEPGWVTEHRTGWPREASTPTAESVRSGWPMFIGSRGELGQVFADQRFLGFIDSAGERSWAVLPLVGTSGRLGALRLSYGVEQEFDDDTRRFLRAVAQQCAVALERARLFEQERSAATWLTAGLLPLRLPGVAGLELGARSGPTISGRPVGGDWYDVFALPDGSVSLAVGDVMGHGLPAAAGMGQLRSALRALALADPDPGAVLAGLDRLVEQGGPAEMATVAYAVLDPADGRVSMADAGHPPLAHLPMDGPARLVDPGSGTTPIGVPEQRSARRVQLRRGAVVVGFTDGLVESRNRSLDEGLAMLLSCLDGVRDQPLEIILDTVVATMVDAAGADDWTVLGLRWTGS
ncbi:MAG TPA: SpoIIE family protein phosphatase [Jiangellaceae bacterium]|jgi:serine phosphatase RsbU (regulator of sigma subunit)|nr:SpoIIE family protein phosphatase [Jiangellaceae bacterium]